MNVLIDTCVVIDALQKREPFWPDSELILKAVASGKITGIISAKSITDIYYLMRKNLHNESKTRSLISILFEIFQIADTTALNCKNALTSKMTDYEDAIQTECAVSNGIDYIITRNITDYKDSVIQAILPDDFIKNFL